MKVSFVALRFDYAGAEIDTACAIGLVKVENGQVTDELFEEFQPDSSDFSMLWQKVEEFVQELPLVANSARIYMRTLHLLWETCSLQVRSHKYLCTQVLGRKLTNLGSFYLDFYAEKFGFDLPVSSNALDKARATSAIMLGLIEISGSNDLDALVVNSEIQWGSVSSAEIVSCKSLSRIGQSPSKSDLNQIRQTYAESGFDATNVLFEKYVLITGTLRLGTRAEVDNALAKAGAFPEVNLTKLTNYLVVGDDKIDGLSPNGKPTGKITKALAARAKGQIIEIIDENTFRELLGE